MFVLSYALMVELAISNGEPIEVKDVARVQTHNEVREVVRKLGIDPDADDKWEFMQLLHVSKGEHTKSRRPKSDC